MPIRTVRLQGSSGEMGIGAGITYDSIAEEEWNESLLKGRFLTHAQADFQLFETILWRHGKGYWLLDAHLKRLADGAHFFKFSCDFLTVRARLLLEEKTFNDGCYRVRLVLAKDGRISLTSIPCAAPTFTELPSTPLEDEASAVKIIDFAPESIDVNGPWRFHKTTIRKKYDATYQQTQKEGLFDYIFCNSVGEITEGCITNIIIYREGIYLTPPVASGLLPGVMREHLLMNGDVSLVEKVLTRQDVISAEALFVCNSVRGVVQVKLRTEL